MNIPYRRRSIGGFTLVELLIVVTILALLAALAYPLYQKNVIDARIESARADILKTTAELERYYTKNRTFVGVSDNNLTKNEYFTITISNQSADAYSLTATPKDSDFFSGYVNKITYDSRSGQIVICETASSCSSNSNSKSTP